MKLTRVLHKNLINIPGWRTTRKIIVIESDDWGSIRMPSRKIYELLLSNGIPVDKLYFLKYDCLESEQDLSMLFEILSSFTDIHGNHPVITANTVMANPDFDKIKESDKTEYFYEPFTTTYTRYPNQNRSFALWVNEGIPEKLLWPQFHGREHLHVGKWMNAINSNDPWELKSFEHEVLLGYYSNKSINYMPAFDYTSPKEWESLNTIASEGLALFEKIFGFQSKSFVAPCLISGSHLDRVLKNNGILYHQVGKQYIPAKNDSFKVKNRYWGQKNGLSQIYLRRNVNFEPTSNPDFDWIDNCLSEINIAFRWGKPAVINSHRVNYIGSIFPENRALSLKLLNSLLKSSLKYWPEVEFMTSDSLGQIIAQNSN